VTIQLLSALAAMPALGDEPRETSLTDVTQLTQGFDARREAYFSTDMSWIIFQGTPKGEKNYAMYVAKLKKQAIGLSERAHRSESARRTRATPAATFPPTARR